MSALVAICGLVAAPAAFAKTTDTSGEAGIANWSSYVDEVFVGFESRRWDDESYSEIRFTGCYSPEASWGEQSTTIELWQDRSLQPDRSWGTRTYIWCFEGPGYESTHTWSGLASGSHYVQVTVINGDPGAVGGTLSVDEVYVDTTP